MKNSVAKILKRLLVAGVISISVLVQTTMASQLERISWVTNSDSEQVLALKLDDHPGYVISESANGSIIELTLKDTQLSPDINQLQPRGIVKSSVALSEGENVKIQFLLSTLGRARINPVNDGFQVAITPAVSASSETVGTSEGAKGNAGNGGFSELRFSRVSGDRVQVDLHISGVTQDPAVFKTVEPPRIAFDFFGVENNTGKNVFPIGLSSVESAVVAQGNNRMRLVVNLLNPVDYSLTKVPTGYVLTLGASASAVNSVVSSEDQVLTQTFNPNNKPAKHSIESIDFRRTPNGGGRIIIKLSDPEVAVDLQELGSEIVAVFTNTSVPGELEQRLDVIDFATPVSYVDTYSDGSHAKLVVTTGDRYKQSSVQSGATLILDVSPLTQAEIEAENTDEFGYKGERLSLNFQRISVRAALQVIADFTGLNFVTSDAITGNLSLRLKDVPWDQALDVILQTKGLAMRQKGNVVWVAPADEIAAKEKQALEAQQEVGELEPLISELIRVSYARVEDIADLLKIR